MNTYLVTGTDEPFAIDSADALAEFFYANELDAAERREILALAVGQSFEGGGGAGVDWSIERLTNTPA